MQQQILMLVYVRVTLYVSTFDSISLYYTTEEQGVRAHSLAHNILGVEGRARAPRWD
jgi:hypothetical protein